MSVVANNSCFKTRRGRAPRNARSYKALSTWYRHTSNATPSIRNACILLMVRNQRSDLVFHTGRDTRGRSNPHGFRHMTLARRKRHGPLQRAFRTNRISQLAGRHNRTSGRCRHPVGHRIMRIGWV